MKIQLETGGGQNLVRAYAPGSITVNDKTYSRSLIVTPQTLTDWPPASFGDLLAAHAEQRRLSLGDGASSYLVPRIERSWAAAEAIVAAIDRLSLERQTPATMSVWRDALEAVHGPEQGRLL